MEIAAQCVTALADRQQVMLVIREGSYPRGFPRGELACEKQSEHGGIERVYWFDPTKVLAWLVKHNFLAVRRTEDRKIVIERVAGGKQ